MPPRDSVTDAAASVGTPDPRGDRYDRLLSLIDITHGAGLEIGPLHRPIVRPGDAKVSYVDVFDLSGLREIYKDDVDVPVEEIVAPDYALIVDGVTRSLSEAVAPGAPFDWIIASHVIEHVPDLIGWLEDIARVAETDGHLALIVPDFRFTFDAARPMTTVGQMLLAHHNRDVVPSVRAVYDHAREVVYAVVEHAWNGWRPTPANRIHTLDHVRERTTTAMQTDQYLDCHVWLFTPWTFVRQLRELAEMGVLDFAVDRILATARNEFEFFASLRRLDPALTPEDRLAAQLRSFERAERSLGAEPTLGATDETPRGWEVRTLSPLESGLIRRKRATMKVVRGGLARAKRLARR